MSESFDRWQASFRNEKTAKNWTALAEQYRSWRGLSWDELLAERTRSFYPDQALPMAQQAIIKRQVEGKVKEFLTVFEKRGYSPATVRQALKAIKSFYYVASYETMELNLKGLRLPHGTVIESLPPTAEEISKLLTFGSLRERALVAFLAETGWGGELLAKADIDWIDRSEGIPYIVLQKRGKTGEHVTTFVGSRAGELLDAYIKTRTVGEVAPLFTNNRGQRLVSKRVNQTVVRLAEKAGLNRKLYRGRNSFHAYSLRHFFQTTLEDAKVPSNWIKSMMGHSLGDVEGAYSKPRILQMREAYKLAYPKLIGSAAPLLSAAPNLSQTTVAKIVAVIEALSRESGNSAIQQNVEQIVTELRGQRNGG